MKRKETSLRRCGCLGMNRWMSLRGSYSCLGWFAFSIARYLIIMVVLMLEAVSAVVMAV